MSFSGLIFGYGENALSRLLGCGQDREGPLGCEGKLLLGHAQQVRMGPGDGRRIVSRPARMRQPIRGPGRPRELVSAGGRPQAGAGLAGDVTLEAADDLLPGRPSLLRRSAWARAGGCEPSRVITIRHRAWLASRPPPGPGRWRVTFPDDAGIGAAAHRCAQAASERSRSGWSPAAMSSSAAVPGADAVTGEQARGVAGHEGDDELAGAAGLAAGELGAPAEFPQRDAGGVAGDVTGTGTQSGGLGGERGHGVPGEPGPRVRWPGQDQGPGPAVRLGPPGAGGPPGGPSARGPPPRCRRGPGARRGPGQATRPGQR